MFGFLKRNKPDANEWMTHKMRHYSPVAAKQKQGAAAEQLACAFLINHGLALLDANVACVQGEIDLIMQEGDTLVFVEVRWRKSSAFGGAAASITAAKLKKINAACDVFLQYNPKWRNAPCRIDAVLLQGDLSEPHMEWLKNITG